MDIRTRRDALRLGLGVCVGLPAVSALNACTQCSKPESTGSMPSAAPESTTANSAPAQTDSTEADLVSESDPTATALNFKQNAADVPAELQQDKDGTPFAQQRCSNCKFYNAADGSDRGACQLLPSGKVLAKVCQVTSIVPGACQLPPSGKVLAGGWCSAWTPKQS